MVWGVSSGKNLQKEVCRDKQLSVSETRKSELESGDSEQADEVIDGQVDKQAKLKALSGFTGHAQKDSVLQFPAEITIQAGESTALHCNFSTSYTNPIIYWYQQRQSQSPQMLLWLWRSKAHEDTGRFSSTLTVETSQVLLNVRDAELQDSAAYFCALSTHCINSVSTDKLVFGSGTTLTVEPNIQKSSNPQVIVMKSKNLEGGGSIGKAACLARNVNTKTISLEMPSNVVVYEQSTPILTSVGLYDTIKVVNVTKDTELTCTAQFNNKPTTANATLPEKEPEEPVTEKVCNTTDTSAQDTKVEKANMLSVAVLGLRVLLAKSIAFNTLMSIKLFLF
ncbi:T cell receptor alpha chain MC.7.G5-like isoform X2 [Buteo buteo]|uniref:T cell receptor alpha chain MC.7.G5-like isoform X2 n=1 Tax=Buteo buteo TaxID=30397 RepID=UPI003EBBFFC3